MENVLKEMQELINKIEKLEEKKFKYTASQELKSKYEEIDLKMKKFKEDRENAKGKIYEIEEKVLKLRNKISTMTDPDEARSVYKDIEKLEFDKDFYQNMINGKLVERFYTESEELHESPLRPVAERDEFLPYREEWTQLIDEFESVNKRVEELSLSLKQRMNDNISNHPCAFARSRRDWYKIHKRD